MSTFTVALIGLSIAPFAVYFAMKKPLFFPMGLYVMMVPVDGLFSTGTTATLTRFVAIGAAAALIAFMFVHRRVLAPPRSWVLWATYMAMCCLTALWTIDSDRTIFTLTQLLQLFAFFSVIAIFPAEPGDVRALGGIVIASGTFTSIWGLFDYFFNLAKQTNRLTVGLDGLQMDPNHVAAALLLPISLTIGTLLSSRSNRIRVVAFAALSVMISALLLTGSRGALIALGAMLLYFAWRTRYRFQILSLMAFGGLLSLLEPTVWERFNDAGLGGGSGRVFIWDVAFAVFKQYWLLGTGIGAFPAAYDHQLLAIYQPVFQGWSRPSHDAFLSATIEVGVLGGIVHLLGWWFSWKDSEGNIVIEASIFGLAVASLFLDVLVIKYIWLAFSMAVLVKNAAEPRFLRGKQPLPLVVQDPGFTRSRRLHWPTAGR